MKPNTYFSVKLYIYLHINIFIWTVRKEPAGIAPTSIAVLLLEVFEWIIALV
jgi:hypothetical protein